MSLFDQWSSDLQKTFKSLSESANWKPAEVMGDLASSEAKIAEKLVHQQSRYISDSVSQFSKHMMDMMSKTDPVVAAEAHYSFFCDQQVKASSQYLSVLDLMGEARELMTEKVNTAFTR
ncbi:hypothetical protein [Oceanospirillum linum]|uniref:Phasin domain-containing protein n=1 Tax=Oceanospirillum linum TaxID=966 RepID=A0A1T1HF96_OCELI|nr:hypothetical protein [Oceanospirillum linum]OOV88503.1 hypothetical protein BTA35_0203075 [Oceanospirillum linum]SEF58486.1 Phasin protein [Oleiphilus messinensis]SMP06440.1 Phasin protein [Oceanospirillum linum]